jgi:DNA-binding CsgD family transcriptional regulator
MPTPHRTQQNLHVHGFASERDEDLRLTAREREVLAWVARGKTNPEIAQLLWITPGTVRKHLDNIFGKLNVHTRTAAAVRFLGLSDSRND